MSHASDASDVLLRRLGSIAVLSKEDAQAVRDTPISVTDLRAHQDIIRQGDVPSRCCVILDGMAATYKTTREGKRQITAFRLAGDVPDLQSLHLSVADSSIATLTPSRLGFMRHDHIQLLCQRHPAIAAALWKMTLIDGAIFREWTANIGLRKAQSRLAHLMCEILFRLHTMGLSDGASCHFPMRQSDLAEATGLSTVHINRTLQSMRSAQLLRLTNFELTVLDKEKLAAMADFDPAYLHALKRTYVALQALEPGGPWQCRTFDRAFTRQKTQSP